MNGNSIIMSSPSASFNKSLIIEILLSFRYKYCESVTHFWDETNMSKIVNQEMFVQCYISQFVKIKKFRWK